jgi:hypothetical protein
MQYYKEYFLYLSFILIIYLKIEYINDKFYIEKNNYFSVILKIILSKILGILFIKNGLISISTLLIFLSFNNNFKAFSLSNQTIIFLSLFM